MPEELQVRIKIKATPTEFGIMADNYSFEIRPDDIQWTRYSMVEAAPSPDQNPISVNLYAGGSSTGTMTAYRKPGGSVLTVWAEPENWPELKESWDLLLLHMKQIDYDPQPVSSADEVLPSSNEDNSPEPLQELQARVTIKVTPAEFGVMVANYAREFRVGDGLPSSSSEYFASGYPSPNKNPVEVNLYAGAGGFLGLVIATKKPGGALLTVWAEKEDWPPIKRSWEMLLARMKQLDYDPQPVGKADETVAPPTAEERDAISKANSELKSRLVLTVEQTCERLGWNMEIDHITTTFTRIRAALPEWGRYNLEISFDMETPGRLFDATDSNGHLISQYSPPEVTSFWESLRDEFEQTIEKWVKEKGEAEGARIAYLLTGNKDSSQVPQAAIEQSSNPQDEDRERIEKAVSRFQILPSGRPRDAKYDEAYSKIKRGVPFNEVYSWFCQAAGIANPDSKFRESFRAAMKRREKGEQ